MQWYPSSASQKRQILQWPPGEGCFKSSHQLQPCSTPEQPCKAFMQQLVQWEAARVVLMGLVSRRRFCVS